MRPAGTAHPGRHRAYRPATGAGARRPGAAQTSHRQPPRQRHASRRTTRLRDGPGAPVRVGLPRGGLRRRRRLRPAADGQRPRALDRGQRPSRLPRRLGDLKRPGTGNHRAAPHPDGTPRGEVMRVAIYDGFTMFREALTMALVSAGFEIVGCANEPVALATLVSDLRPDACVLTDTPGAEARFSAALQVRRGRPAPRPPPTAPRGAGPLFAGALRGRGVRPAPGLLLLTDVGNIEAQRAYDGGVVDAVVSKTCDVDVLDKAIRRVLVGERVLEGWSPPAVPPRSAVTSLSRLTDREREVLTLIAGGASTSVMSMELGVSVNTVRTHVQSVLDKLNVHHRTMAARVAVEHGLCSAMR